MNNNEKKLEIKVPVYTSEIFEKDSSLFGNLTPSQLIEGIKKTIDTYTLNPFPITDEAKNKTTKREIDNVEYKECSFFNGNNPALLLKISAHNTNFADGYYQSSSKVPIGKNDKIGSENNYVVLYPNMLSISPLKDKYQWIFMIYEDPHKNVDELIRTVKLVLKNLLKIPVRNIKLSEVMRELQERKVSELRVKYHTLTYDENEVDEKFSTYFTSGKITKQIEQVFKNIPHDDVEEILEIETQKSGWDKLSFKLFDRKKEYRITKTRISEAIGKISSSAEAIFNERCPIDESELDMIYEEDFIAYKLEPILYNYISCTDENRDYLQYP